MQATGIQTKWVNSDRQLADVLTKATASPASILKLQNTGRWKIVWDETFTSAKNLRKEKRDAHFKKVCPPKKRKTQKPSHSHLAEGSAPFVARTRRSQVQDVVGSPSVAAGH